MIEPVEVHIVLNTAQDKAFRAFTADINSWWPVKSHSICQGIVSFDPVLGGEIVETGTDGAKHIWAHVTHWNPPYAFRIEWYVGQTPKDATQIDVRFDATDDGRTGVTLTHSGWEVLGEAAISSRDGYQSGWSSMLRECFAPFAESDPS